MTTALFAGCIAAAIAVLAGKPLIAFLREKKLGKAISADGPESHMVKAGTPTFGGLLIFGVSLPVALIAVVPQDADMLLPIAVAGMLALVGFYDDLGTLIDRGQREAHDRTTMVLKLVAFAVIGVGASLLLYEGIDAPRLLVPHYGHYDIGPIYVLIAIGVFVSTTSAVGVSDGLDMLCGSTSAVAIGAFGVIALMQEQDALATFCFALVGALLGFLWWNAYPARIFMGDSGSLPLGGTLAIVALMTGWWLLVPLIGVIFVVVIASNVIQIGYFRMTGGKRVFRMAPIHHHFEKLGVPEVQITVAFLVITILGALAGIALVALD
ncbi:MAG: phospho-N-acetylmuramoyl-pentapeptide-transferase [Dehalococcoidia bacterium]